MKRLQEEIVVLKSDIASLKDLTVYKKNLTKDVGFLNQEVKRVKKVNQQLREDTIGLCHDLLRTGLRIANRGRSHQSTLIAARIGKLSQSDVIEQQQDEEEGQDVFVEDGDIQLHTTEPASSGVWEPLHSGQTSSPSAAAVPRNLSRHSSSASVLAAHTDPDDIWRSDSHRNANSQVITAQVGRRQKLQASMSKTGNSISSFYTIQKVEDGAAGAASRAQGPLSSSMEGKLPQVSSSFSMMY